MKADDNIEPLPVVRAADLTEPDAKRRWLVEGLWTRGVGIIGGLPKSCKSWLGLDLALSVASDTPCLGHFRIHDPGRTLIYMAEDTAAVVKERLLGLCRHREIDLGRVPIHVITAPTVRLDLERDRRRLTETIRRNRPRLLLLDPLIRCHRLDENDVGQVSGLLAFLRALQRDHDVSIAVVHHARKNGAGHHGQNLRGSGDFHAWVDSGLYLRRTRDRLVLVAEHRAAPASPPIEIALVTTDAEMAHLEVIGQHDGNLEAAEDLSVDAAILRLLDRAGDEPLSRDELRTTLRIRNARVSEALSRLATAGKIKKQANGWLRRAVPIPSL